MFGSPYERKANVYYGSNFSCEKLTAVFDTNVASIYDFPAVAYRKINETRK